MPGPIGELVPCNPTYGAVVNWLARRGRLSGMRQDNDSLTITSRGGGGFDVLVQEKARRNRHAGDYPAAHQWIASSCCTSVLGFVPP